MTNASHSRKAPEQGRFGGGVVGWYWKVRMGQMAERLFGCSSTPLVLLNGCDTMVNDGREIDI